jgi:WD40 repeat protein
MSSKEAKEKLIDDQIDSNLTAIIGITVLSYSEKQVDKKSVIFYNVEVKSNITQNTWVIDKRYSEFFAMHEKLSKLFPRLPTIPGKTIGKVKSESALTKRKELLEIFLRECVKRRDILRHPDFQQFLELDENAPEVVGNTINLVYEYKKLPMGVRDFIVVPHREIMLVCCSNMDIVSRSKIKLTNFAFGKRKGDDCKIPMGAAFIYQCKPDEKEIYKIHKIWAHAFPVQTGVISWEDEHELYSIGLDDGRVLAFKAEPNTHYLEMKKICELCFHTDRVMGVAIDPKTFQIYTCSTDKTFYTTDLTKTKVENILISKSNAGYTNLIMDAKNRRVFLTNESGELTVYSLETSPPSLVRSLQTSSLSSIRAFHADFFNNYLFTGNVGGKICIMNLPPQNKARLISEISNFGVGEQKIRVCTNDPNTYELITGDENGRVTIWNLKNGKPVYLWEAHPKSPITQIWYQPEHHLLWTGGKDLKIKIWQLPEKWFSKEVEVFEQEEVSNITAKKIEEKLEKINIKKEEGEEADSDDDDLNGWCYRKF